MGLHLKHPQALSALFSTHIRVQTIPAQPMVKGTTPVPISDTRRHADLLVQHGPAVYLSILSALRLPINSP